MNQLLCLAFTLAGVVTILTACSYEHKTYLEGDLNHEHESIEDSAHRR